MKTCFKCGSTKERTEFYAHKAMADGLLGKCKECTKRDTAERAARIPDKIKAYDKARAMLPHRVAARKEYASRETSKAAIVEYTRHRRFEVEPEKYKARTAVNNAVRDGRLIKTPCVRCGTTYRVQGHHKDYSKPLDVNWLCVSCHTKEHRKEANDDQGIAEGIARPGQAQGVL